MGKLPDKALAKFGDANKNFKDAADDPFAPGLPPPPPRRVDLKEVKTEIIELDARMKRIAQGLADFKDGTEMAFEEVKRELTGIEEMLRRGSGGMSGITPSGEQFRRCGEHVEDESIYSCYGEEAPPRITITGHGKNSHGNSECTIVFKFYTVLNNEEKLVYTDTVSNGSSTPSRRGRWSRVTATCLSSSESSECRISWTEQP